MQDALPLATSQLRAWNVVTVKNSGLDFELFIRIIAEHYAIIYPIDRFKCKIDCLPRRDTSDPVKTERSRLWSYTNQEYTSSKTYIQCNSVNP